MNSVVLRTEAQLSRSMQKESKVNTNFPILGKLDFLSLWGRPMVIIAT